MSKSLQEAHEDVPPDYYDKGIQNNFFQRLWHKKRFSLLHRFIKRPRGKILDVGCHSGLFTSEIIKNNKDVEVYGIDISKNAIAYAKKRIKNGHFYQGDAHKLPFKNNFFDTAYCLEMLEHVERPNQVISEIYRVLKEGGDCYILIPIENVLFKTIWFFWNLYSPVWKHTHVQSFRGKTAVSPLQQEGFRSIRMRRSHLNMLLFIECKK